VGLVDGGLELAFGQAGDDGDEGFGFGHGWSPIGGVPLSISAEKRVG
jgi:hypothetical protein